MARKAVVLRTFLGNDGNVVEVGHGSSVTSHGLTASILTLRHRGRRHWSLLVALWVAGRTRRKAKSRPRPDRQSEVIISLLVIIPCYARSFRFCLLAGRIL